jgi:hypothetical protein
LPLFIYAHPLLASPALLFVVAPCSGLHYARPSWALPSIVKRSGLTEAPSDRFWQAHRGPRVQHVLQGRFRWDRPALLYAAWLMLNA